MLGHTPLSTTPISSLPLSAAPPSGDIGYNNTNTGAQDYTLEIATPTTQTNGGFGPVVFEPVEAPKPKRSRKKAAPAPVVKPAPSPEQIQALTDALLLNIPVGDTVDFDELRQLIAAEQARLAAKAEARAIEDEEEMLILTLFTQYRANTSYR